MVVRSPTGYGNQSGLFLPELAKHYDVACSAFYGLEGSRIVWNGIPILPSLGGEFGNAYLAEHAKRHFNGNPRGGIVLTLLDVWVLQAAMARQLNMACITPVDHEPAPPLVVDFLTQANAIPIAMSRFGEEQLRGLDPLYIPHMVDTEVYAPQDRDECRKLAGVPDGAFLIGMVAANKGRPSRKSFQEALQAFRILIETHDDAYLYLHTTFDPNHANGEDLGVLIDALGIPPTRVLKADQYRMQLDPFSPKVMAQVYSTFDVLLNPSRGEGFGIPVMEANACGVPSVVTNFSAMPEVSGPAGWHVACRNTWTGQNSWQVLPDIEAIVEALARCYGMSKAEKDKRAEMCREHALTYSVPEVMEHYALPALQEIERRFEDREPLALRLAA